MCSDVIWAIYLDGDVIACAYFEGIAKKLYSVLCNMFPENSLKLEKITWEVKTNDK